MIDKYLTILLSLFFKFEIQNQRQISFFYLENNTELKNIARVREKNNSKEIL